MRSSPEVQPDDDRCPVCHESVFRAGVPYFIEVSAGDRFVGEGFCSWGHLAEWAASGQPAELEGALLEDQQGNRWREAWEITVVIGIFAAIGAVLGLAGWGFFALFAVA